MMRSLVSALLLCLASGVLAAERVVDIPTRPDVTQRFVYLQPDNARATLILFTGGPGGLRISAEGRFAGGEGNFLVRSRERFAASGFSVIVVDAPSDRQQPPYMDGSFRQSAEHLADIQAVIAWARRQSSVPVWLVGTSRGTQSAAHIALSVPAALGADGLVLTSSILRDNRTRALPQMALDAIRIPTLVLHHQQDACRVCPPAELPRLMDKLEATPRKALILVDGGMSLGDPCEAKAYHGFNGIEQEVVDKIADWVLATPRP